MSLAFKCLPRQDWDVKLTSTELNRKKKKTQNSPLYNLLNYINFTIKGLPKTHFTGSEKGKQSLEIRFNLKMLKLHALYYMVSLFLNWVTSSKRFTNTSILNSAG